MHICYEPYLISHFFLQFSQNIVKFKTSSKKEQELSLEEVVKVVDYWFNSRKETTTEKLGNLIKKFEPVTDAEANVGYFTQAAWANSHKMGKC